MKSVYIYGLFCRKTGKCLYIGRTTDVTKRFNCHRTVKTTKGVKFVLTVFDRVKQKYGPRAEAREIKRYKDRGEATLNTVTGKTVFDRTITQQEAIDKIKSMSAGDTIITHSKSDRSLLVNVASALLQLEITKIFLKSRKGKTGDYELVAMNQNAAPGRRY